MTEKREMVRLGIKWWRGLRGVFALNEMHFDPLSAQPSSIKLEGLRSLDPGEAKHRYKEVTRLRIKSDIAEARAKISRKRRNVRQAPLTDF
jgi:hypothetical protein